jgi:hypothetical protein
MNRLHSRRAAFGSIVPSGCPFAYSASNFEVLALIAFMLQKIDPVDFFVQGEILNQSLQREGNGTASYLLVEHS